MIALGLDGALDRLLHDRSYREAFVAGRLEALGLTGEELEALASIDREELSRAAARVRDDLLHRKHRGSGGLLSLYPGTLAAWTAAHPDDPELFELLSRFMEAGEFAAYREIPFSGVGCSLEEVFYRFCEEEDIGESARREQEYLTAMMKALLVSPRAAFELPAEVHVCPGGFFAVSGRGDPMLHAAVGGRLITGPLTPFLVDLILSADSSAEVAERHGVAPAVCVASVRQLTELGILSPGGRTSPRDGGPSKPLGLPTLL